MKSLIKRKGGWKKLMRKNDFSSLNKFLFDRMTDLTAEEKADAEELIDELESNISELYYKEQGEKTNEQNAWACLPLCVVISKIIYTVVNTDNRMKSGGAFKLDILPVIERLNEVIKDLGGRKINDTICNGSSFSTFSWTLSPEKDDFWRMIDKILFNISNGNKEYRLKDIDTYRAYIAKHPERKEEIIEFCKQ